MLIASGLTAPMHKLSSPRHQTTHNANAHAHAHSHGLVLSRHPNACSRGILTPDISTAGQSALSAFLISSATSPAPSHPFKTSPQPLTLHFAGAEETSFVRTQSAHMSFGTLLTPPLPLTQSQSSSVTPLAPRNAMTTATTPNALAQSTSNAISSAPYPMTATPLQPVTQATSALPTTHQHQLQQLQQQLQQQQLQLTALQPPIMFTAQHQVPSQPPSQLISSSLASLGLSPQSLRPTYSSAFTAVSQASALSPRSPFAQQSVRGNISMTEAQLRHRINQMEAVIASAIDIGTSGAYPSDPKVIQMITCLQRTLYDISTANNSQVVAIDTTSAQSSSSTPTNASLTSSPLSSNAHHMQIVSAAEIPPMMNSASASFTINAVPITQHSSQKRSSAFRPTINTALPFSSMTTSKTLASLTPPGALAVPIVKTELQGLEYVDMHTEDGMPHKRQRTTLDSTMSSSSTPPSLSQSVTASETDEMSDLEGESQSSGKITFASGHGSGTNSVATSIVSTNKNINNNNNNSTITPSSKRRDRSVLPCLLLNSINKTPLHITQLPLAKQYTVSKKDSLAMSEEEASTIIDLNLRFMGNARGDDHIYIVAKDLCLVLHIRKGNVAKQIGQFNNIEKARMPVLCPRSDGTLSTHILTVLSVSGMRRLLSSVRPNRNAMKIRRWIHEQLQLLLHPSADSILMETNINNNNNNLNDNIIASNNNNNNNMNINDINSITVASAVTDANNSVNIVNNNLNSQLTSTSPLLALSIAHELPGISTNPTSALQTSSPTSLTSLTSSISYPSYAYPSSSPSKTTSLSLSPTSFDP